MIVPDEVRKCVAFVGTQMADGSFRMLGSGFFIGRDEPDGTASHVRFVTARHVIDGIRRKLLTEVFLRVNRKSGDAVWLRTQSDGWITHPSDPSVDVAIYATGIPAEFDHVAIPLSLSASAEALKANEVALGDEVFITGLFRHFHGAKRNIPIVRVGNIASLNEEKIQTRDFGEIDAYLIEARSIGGLSGSPVFVNLGVVRRIQGQIKHAASWPNFLLFGLIHGHFDASSTMVDSMDVDGDIGLTPARVNTGIAIVVPFQKLEEVIRESITD